MLKALKRLLELDGEFVEEVEGEIAIEKINIQIADLDAQRVELDTQIIEKMELLATQGEGKVREAVLSQHDEIAKTYEKLNDSSSSACLQGYRAGLERI